MATDTLQNTVREIVDRAFSEGAQWACIWRHGEDSAKVGRELNRWTQDPNYRSIIAMQYEKAERDIARAVMRVAAEAQASLQFRKAEGF